MRKITFIAALAFCIMGANAQTVNFTRNGEVVPDGTTLNITDAIDQGSGYGKCDAEILIKNEGTTEVSASLTITVKDGENIGYCGFDEGGMCVQVGKGTPVTRTKKLATGEENNPEVHTMMAIELANPTPFNSTVEYKLVYGTTTKTVTVNFAYNPTSINSVNANVNIFQTGNQLNYSFDKAANHQLNVYNVTGSLVKKQALDNAGTVTLNLNKGVYIYEIKENGKRIAAHKCVIR